ncbi:MAG: YveK family protein [Lachnospiraceae bacterium]
MNEEAKNGYFNTGSLILDVFDLLNALKKRIWLILLVGIIGGILANLGTRVFIEPTYRTSFTAYVNNRTNLEGTTSVTSSDLSAAKSLANTYAQILTSRFMIELAAEKAGMQDMEDMLSNAVAVSVSPDTEILTVSVTMTDPDLATQFAQVLAEVAPERMSKIVEGSSMQIIDEPVRPTGKYAPNYRRNTGIGAIAGMALICMVILLMEVMNDCVKDEDDLRRRYDLVVIGTIPNLLTTDKHGSGYEYGYGTRKDKWNNETATEEESE